MSVTAPVSDSSTRPVQVKLVLLGESAVGKSSVVLRFCQNDFQANKEPTIGAAFLTQRCRLEDKVIKFEIWDTAGQERFRSLSPMYYRNAQSAVVVYDVTKAASLEQAKTWVKELQRQANPNIVIALVGNKVDLVRASSSEEDATPATPTGTGSDEEEDDATATPEGDDSVEEDAENAAPNESRRQVPREEAEAYAKENGLLFFEASAKTGEGVVEVFTEIAKKIPLDHILASTRAPGGTARGTGRNAPGAAGRIDLNEAEAAKTDAYSSPFNDPPSEPRSRYLASSRSVSQSNISSSMREALKDVVTIRPVVNSPSRSTSGPVPIAKDDILTSTSPAKQRESNRDKSSPSKSRSKESSKEGEKERAKGGENKKEGTAGKGKKADVPFDVIDRLDISGLYGGGSFHRHDGPYAAATASRNKGPRAPMAAFDPSALAPPASGSRPPRNGSSALSARAQATLAAMDIEAAKAGESPYGAGALPRRALGRRASDSSITMGFPSTAANGKGQQLIEIYGVRDNEAWEDFGTSRFTAVGDGQSFSSSKESVGPVAGSGEDRDRLGRAQSIWDIEATLRAGKPVGQSLPPPPTPIILHELTSPPLPSVSGSTDNKPKRSKSLVQRFRAGRRNPNNPISDDYEEPDALAAPASSPMTIPSSSTPLNMVRDENGRFSSSEGAPPAPQGARSLPTTIRFKSAESPARTRQTLFTAPSTAPPVPTSRGFGGGVPLAGSRSLGQEGVVETPTREVPVRRPSVMQRLFSSKGK